jgi:hypothetical protein
MSTGADSDLASSRRKLGRRWVRLLTALLVATALHAGCGGGSGGDDYTLKVEVTSSGSPIGFTGTVSPHNGPVVPIQGTTPFSTSIHDTTRSCDSFNPTCFTGASATVNKTTKTTDVMTVCLRNGDKSCQSTTVSSDSVFVLLLF